MVATLSAVMRISSLFQLKNLRVRRRREGEQEGAEMKTAPVHHLAAEVYASVQKGKGTIVNVTIHLQRHDLLLHVQQLQPPIRIERPPRTHGDGDDIKGIVTGFEVLIIELLLSVALAVLRA